MAGCVLVTGTSRGIGAAVAEELLGRGVRVFGVSRTPNAALNGHRQFVHVEADLADHANLHAVWKRVEHLVAEQQGVLNGLVNAADVHRKIMDVNFEAPFALCKLYSSYLLKRKIAASIINVGSVVGSAGNDAQTSYASSKASLIGLSTSLAKELGSRNIRVNVVEPGFVDTEMTRGIPLTRRDAILNATALGRFGTPKEIAKLCAFLYSEDSSFITGRFLLDNLNTSRIGDLFSPALCIACGFMHAPMLDNLCCLYQSKERME